MTCCAPVERPSCCNTFTTLLMKHVSVYAAVQAYLPMSSACTPGTFKACTQASVDLVTLLCVAACMLTSASQHRPSLSHLEPAGIWGVVVPWDGAQHGGLPAESGLGPAHLHPVLAAMEIHRHWHPGQPPACPPTVIGLLSHSQDFYMLAIAATFDPCCSN